MQNFENMAMIEMQTARDLLDGKSIKVVNFIPLDIVDLSNIDTFTPPEW